jgi:hypothetical protein
MLSKEELKILIKSKFYDEKNNKIKTRLISEEIKSIIQFYTTFYQSTSSKDVNIRAYFILNDITVLNKCKNCGIDIHPSSLLRYKTQEYCGTSCSNSHIKKINQIKQTILNRYGVESAMQSDIIREKAKQTNIERYGVDNAFKDADIREKAKQTNLERYGVDNVFKDATIREKAKKTNIERYGVDNVFKDADIREKAKQTNIERYGTETPFHSSAIQDKIKQTNLERYGVTIVSKNETIKEKIKQTNMERYGVESSLSSTYVRKKIKQTNLERYGVENPFGNTEIQENIKQTNLERYGVENPSKRHISQESLNILNDKELFCQFIKDKPVYEITKELGVESTLIYRLLNKYELQDYYQKRGPTYLEIEMKEFLDNNNISYEINNRTILGGQELDFYIPDYNIAIEMNGVYWHSDKFKINKNYHYDKWKICNDQGIHLISIFEDDWNLQKDKICNMILNFFNKKPKGIPARKTHIQKINGKIARNFLDQYHLQGYVTGTHYGAFDINDNLIGVMTFGTTRNGRFELKRFVTDNYTHSGLFSKLFKYAQNDLQFTEVVSFSDNTCFTGNVYKINGFNFIKVIGSDYRYLFNGKRVHKSNFKKSNIKQKFPELSESIDNGMTETQAMTNLGIYKIYDCGKCEWVWKTA